MARVLSWCTAVLLALGACTIVGSVTLEVGVNGGGTTNPEPGAHVFTEGRRVAIEAVPECGWAFQGWSGAATGHGNPVTLVMDGDKAITAEFAKVDAPTYALTIHVEGEGSTLPAAGTRVYCAGTTAHVTAIPAGQASFTGWKGAATGSTNPIDITMDSDKELTATFSTTSRTLTLAVSGSGTTSPAAGSCTYPAGSAVEVTATPASGAKFTGWSGDATGTSEKVTVTLDSNKSLTATFGAASRTLTIAVSGSGTTSPAAGSHTYPAGSAVEVTATPASGAKFTGWSGGATGTSEKVTVTLDSDKSLTATFDREFQPCPTTPGAACVVLPLGDSITWGYLSPFASTNGGYRVELFKQAVLANKNITFVGSQTNGPDTVQNRPFPKSNEGHPGYTIETVGQHPGIAGQITDSVISQNHPNIVLLMIGTNDVSLNIDLPNAPSRLGKLIDEIVAGAPTALVVVSNILPFADATLNQTALTYNAAIPAVVDARAAEGNHVVFFDSYTAFSKNPNFATSLMSDSIHPNDAGYAVMGQAFYDKISAVLP